MMRRCFFFAGLALAATLNLGCHNSLNTSMEQMDQAPLINGAAESPPAPIRVHGGIGP